MAFICITGTPGTGKTELSKILARKLGYKRLDVKNIIKKQRLFDYFDKSKKTYIVDPEKLNPYLIKIIKKEKNLIIDSHLSHCLPKKYVDLCIVAKCNLKVLKQRLEKRRYNKSKVRENLDSEIFDVCLNEAREKDHNTLKIDSTKKIADNTINRVLAEVKKLESTGRRTK